MKHWGTMSRGATESMLKPARLRTERRIMPSATRMKGFGMGSRCSSTSSTISSVSLAKGLSITCAAPSNQPAAGLGVPVTCVISHLTARSESVLTTPAMEGSREL